jgi:hypothetical protein
MQHQQQQQAETAFLSQLTLWQAMVVAAVVRGQTPLPAAEVVDSLAMAVAAAAMVHLTVRGPEVEQVPVDMPAEEQILATPTVQQHLPVVAAVRRDIIPAHLVCLPAVAWVYLDKVPVVQQLVIQAQAARAVRVVKTGRPAKAAAQMVDRIRAQTI